MAIFLYIPHKNGAARRQAHRAEKFFFGFQ